MSARKIGTAVASGVAIASLLVVGADDAAAKQSHRHAAAKAHRVQVAPAARHWYYGGYAPTYGYVAPGGQYVPGPRDRLIYGPGYVFAPGKGILGEDCNMPTSTCTNEYRDVR